MGTKNVRWHIVPSMTDPEMFAVKGHYEFGELHPVYIVADNVPIEDATLIAAAPEMYEALEAAFQLIPSLSVVQWPPGHTLKREAQEKVRKAILKAKGVRDES